MQLTCADIHFDYQVKTKDQALYRVVQALTEAGHTRMAYLKGMRTREGQISTYLGNGIAIPHGTPQSRDAVEKTGVKVLVCPQGINWDQANTAYLIVGIAARDREHLDILRQLTHALGDQRMPAALIAADTPQAVLNLLTGGNNVASDNARAPVRRFDEEAIFTLPNLHGLHARPGAILVNTVRQWQADITVENLDTQSPIVDAKNLMRIVSLSARQGHRLHFMASGIDASLALKAIGHAFDTGLGESADSLSQTPPDVEKAPRSWLSRLFS